MTYESRTPALGLGARTNRRVKDKVDKDTEAAEKIAGFFTKIKIPGLNVSQTSCAYVDPSKINITRTGDTMTVQHRNKSTQVVGLDLDAVETTFREWCASEMCHAKVFPRKCSK
ncbi:hypothetical protein K2Q00_00905 [Patescibacteria group bacterium]|nr:hypothetical protein [Patescibacteria group bacterium]